MEEKEEKEPTNTTLPLEKTTRNRVAEFGRKREKYDDILHRLMDFYEEHHIKTRL